MPPDEVIPKQGYPKTHIMGNRAQGPGQAHEAFRILFFVVDYIQILGRNRKCLTAGEYVYAIFIFMELSLSKNSNKVVTRDFFQYSSIFIGSDQLKNINDNIIGFHFPTTVM